MFAYMLTRSPRLVTKKLALNEGEFGLSPLDHQFLLDRCVKGTTDLSPLIVLIGPLRYPVSEPQQSMAASPELGSADVLPWTLGLRASSGHHTYGRVSASVLGGLSHAYH